MKIQLDLSTQLQERAGLSSNEITLDGPCGIQEAAQAIIQSSRAELKAFLFDDDGRLRPAILLSINDRQIDWQENPIVNEGDRISILSPIAGG